MPFLPALLLSHCFFLASHSPFGATAGSCVGARTLSMHRQVSAMAHATIAANFNQPLDVHIDFAAQVAFNLMFAVDHFTQAVDFFFSQVARPRIRVNVRSIKDLAARGKADPIDVRQRNLNAFVAWNVNAGDSSHLSLQLPLLLFMLGVFATDNHHNTLPADDLAVLTAWFNRGAYFH